MPFHAPQWLPEYCSKRAVHRRSASRLAVVKQTRNEPTRTPIQGWATMTFPERVAHPSARRWMWNRRCRRESRSPLSVLTRWSVVTVLARDTWTYQDLGRRLDLPPTRRHLPTGLRTASRCHRRRHNTNIPRSRWTGYWGRRPIPRRQRTPPRDYLPIRIFRRGQRRANGRRRRLRSPPGCRIPPSHHLPVSTKHCFLLSGKLVEHVPIVHSSVFSSLSYIRPIPLIISRWHSHSVINILNRMYTLMSI